MDEWDVFLVHSSEDGAVASAVHKGLEEVGLRVLDFHDKIFAPGTLIYENIVHAVQSSTCTLVILTKNALESSWVTLETILALEKSQQTQKLCIRLMRCGVPESELKHLKMGVLEGMPHLTLDFNKRDWAEKMKRHFQEDVSIDNILPSGNVAHGQVYSHYMGYFRHILPIFQDKVKQCKWYKDNPGKMSTKYYLLIPGNCNILPTLDTDPRERRKPQITKVGELHFNCPHGGKDREYTPTVYKVNWLAEEYFFIGEFANAMSVLAKLSNLGLAAIDVRLQIGRFYYTMSKVLSYHKKDYSDIVTQLPYHDANESTSETILKAVKKDLASQQMGQMTVDEKNTRVQIDRLNSCGPKNYSLHATIICSEEIKADRDVAVKIQKALKSRKLKWSDDWNDMRNARWNIFIISQESLETEKWMKCKCIIALHESVDEDQLKVVPVTVGIDDDRIPEFLKWVTYIRSEETDCQKKLLQVITGEDRKMQTQLPAGDVATGLVWAYMINYLPITLVTGRGFRTERDLRGRIVDHLKLKGCDCGCLLRFYVIVPKTCVCEKKKINSYRRIEDLDKLEVVKSDQGGVHDRPYYLRMYRLTTRAGKKICFLSEYATPCITLHEMANTFHDSGLTKEQMNKQAKLFASLLDTKIREDPYKTKVAKIDHICKTIYFDDENEDLAVKLEKQIEQDLDDEFEVLTTASR